MIGKNIAGDIDSVFVYGTLMPDSKNEHVAKKAGSYRAEKAYIEGMHLYDLEPEGYPAIVPKDSSSPLDENPSGRVEGYVLHFDDITLALTLLDEFEGCYLEPPDYYRETITVQPSGKLTWVYVYADEARLTRPGASLISSGKWHSDS